MATSYSTAQISYPRSLCFNGNPLNLKSGEWRNPGNGKPFCRSVDGSPFGDNPMLDLESGKKAAHSAKEEFAAWLNQVDFGHAKPCQCLFEDLKQHHELLIIFVRLGNRQTLPSSNGERERCISGVQWYPTISEVMLNGRPASHSLDSFPTSLRGITRCPCFSIWCLCKCWRWKFRHCQNAIGRWFFTLTLAFALGRRAGLLISPISGSGGELSEALARNDNVDCLAFVGGKSNGR